MYKITLEKDDFLRFQLYTASKSKRIRNKRLRSWLLLTFCFPFLGFVFRENPDKFFVYFFLGFALIILFFYPLLQGYQYKRHYEKYINDTYTKRFGVESQLGFKDGFMVNIDNNQEGKIKLTEIEEINEISDNLFIKIKTGQSIIVPTRISNYALFKSELNQLIQPMNIEWKCQQNWKWR